MVKVKVMVMVKVKVKVKVIVKVMVKARTTTHRTCIAYVQPLLAEAIAYTMKMLVF
jgi:hypothetical protein